MEHRKCELVRAYETLTLYGHTGVLDQMAITPFTNVIPIIDRAYLSMVLATFIALAMSIMPGNPTMFWVGITVYFFVAGPTLGCISRNQE